MEYSLKYATSMLPLAGLGHIWMTLLKMYTGKFFSIVLLSEYVIDEVQT